MKNKTVWRAMELFNFTDTYLNKLITKELKEVRIKRDGERHFEVVEVIDSPWYKVVSREQFVFLTFITGIMCGAIGVIAIILMF